MAEDHDVAGNTLNATSTPSKIAAIPAVGRSVTENARIGRQWKYHE
jgi:hypothetical protein